MKKSHLLDIVCALTLFAVIGGANAAIIASDDTSLTGTDQSYAQTFAVSPPSFPGVDLTADVLGDSGQTQPDENFNFFKDGTSSESESSHSDAHASFWLLLIAAAVAGTLSEILYRKSFNR
jgi:hypothetical protein